MVLKAVEKLLYYMFKNQVFIMCVCKYNRYNVYKIILIFLLICYHKIICFIKKLINCIAACN